MTARDGPSHPPSLDDLSLKHQQTTANHVTDHKLAKSLQDLHDAVSPIRPEKKCPEFLSNSGSLLNSSTSSNNELQVSTSTDEFSGKEIKYEDEAVDVDDSGGATGQEVEALRLLVVSTKIRNSIYLRNAIKPNTVFLQYKYDSVTLDGLLNLIQQTLGGRKVECIALLMSCSGPSILITGKDEKILTKESMHDNQPIREFLTSLVSTCLDSGENNRLDFMVCNAVMHADGQAIAKELEALVKIPVTMSRDLMGAEGKDRIVEGNVKPNLTVGEQYFKVDKLRGFGGHHPQQTLAGFEKIQTVGKGAYGAAVLYRKKDDDSLVILKEINMHDLNASERQLALNEISILAMLDHPNIISYFDSFEEDGVLMIEMEYADGGTLSKHLASLDKPLEEQEILLMFQQIAAAIRHIHEHNILHRDLKTANIFLTKEGVVKVGDFGISKMMSSANKGANTVLGTPYYISPEMCEGKPYNDKSDIWAMGCILYEIACLQKTFEGSNLPALVNKIMKGQFAPVKGNYSQEFKDLIMDMLKQDPDQRPSANELMYTRLPELMNKYEDPGSEDEDVLTTSHSSAAGDTVPKSKKKLRSVFFYFESCTALMFPIELPPKIKIRHAAVGEDHVIVVTMERQVYSWGEGGKGQLGHGNTQSLTRPALVQSLTGKSISRACCGDGFSVFASDNGIILTCGDGSNGCLGHGDLISTYRPRLIEILLSMDVTAVACGPKHVVVVGSEGEVFSWGKGADGRLGLGNEDDYCQPQRVKIPEPVVIREVKCGVDGTMLLSDVGSVFACGSNTDNKLGLNLRQGFIMAMKNIFKKTEVDGQNIPTPVKALACHRVLDISMGVHHTAVIVEPGHIFSFGRNLEGQLGIGDTKPYRAPVEVKSMVESVRVHCGDHFTVCSTTANELYYWGLRFKSPSLQSNPDDEDSKSSTNGSVINRDDLRLESITPRKATSGHSRQASLTSVTSISSLKESIQGSLSSVKGDTDPGTKSTSHQRQNSLDSGAINSLPPPSPTHKRQVSIDSVMSLNDSGVPSMHSQDSNNDSKSRSGFRPLSSIRKRTPSAGSRDNVKDKDKDQPHDTEEMSEIIFPPGHLMKILKSGDEILTISGFFCHGENLFIQMDTTAPPPRRKKRKKLGIRKRFSGNTLNVPPETKALYSASSREGGDEYSSEASEIDTQGTIPVWLKKELRQTEEESKDDDGNEADDTSDQSDDEIRHGIFDSSMTSIQINKDFVSTSPTVPVVRSPRNDKLNKASTNAVKVKSTIKEQNRASLSTNSAESEIDLHTAGFQSDGSTKEHSVRRLTDSSLHKKSGPPSKRKVSAPACSKLPPNPQKPLTRLKPNSRGRGEDLALKEQLAARGFVSDVTVKRKQEALLNELEMTREEKKRAEDKIRELEEEHRYQQEVVRRELERKAQEREQGLEQEIQVLKQQLQSQDSQLRDNNRLLQNLQEELNKVKGRNKGSPGSLIGKDSRVCTVM